MRLLALLSVVLLVGCSGLRPPQYKEPQEGDIARVTFVNTAPATSIINIFEDSEACSQKRFGIFLGSGYQTTRNVRANVPFTYLQGWERIEARATRIDSLGNVHAESRLQGCQVMNTFLPEKDRSYIVRFDLDKKGACQYVIYDEQTRQRVKAYERSFVPPVWETGNFCKPLEMEF